MSTPSGTVAGMGPFRRLRAAIKLGRGRCRVCSAVLRDDETSRYCSQVCRDDSAAFMTEW